MPLFFKYADFGGRGEVIRLEPTDDEGGAWMIAATADTTNWWRQADEARADATVRASRNDLYLFFLGRRTGEPPLLTGDTAMLARWQTALGF